MNLKKRMAKLELSGGKNATLADVKAFVDNPETYAGVELKGPLIEGLDKLARKIKGEGR